MKEICAVMTWFMEIVKLFENLKHLCAAVLWIMFFCYLRHWFP